MSTDQTVDFDDVSDLPGLLDLPIFAQPRAASPAPAERVVQPIQGGTHGRVRSDYTITPATKPAENRIHLVRAADGRVAGEPQESAQREDEEPLDWGLVAVFRQRSADQLSKQLSGESFQQTSIEEQQEMGRANIIEMLRDHSSSSAAGGVVSWDSRFVQRMAQAVFDAQFRMGRLQPLLDMDQVENIMITGNDPVTLHFADGTQRDVDRVADTDAELVEFLQFLASRAKNPRPFSESHPSLHMQLDGGERLAASAWITSRPQAVIRRHRLREVRLEDLVANDTLSPVAASFLKAAVRARKSIVIGGIQGRGKTTMMRALCAEIGPEEPIGTFETEYELGLDQLPEQHHFVVAYEARPGSAELDASGHRAGEYTLKQALIDSFRMNLSRQIVGETRGDEVWTMIKAMESAPGSMCTTHSPVANQVVPKLVTCAMEAGPAITADLATMKLAQAVDLVVQMYSGIDPSLKPGRSQRYVSEIIAITPGEKNDGPGWAATTVFKHVPRHGAIAEILPDEYRELIHYGFDPAAFHAEAAEFRSER